MKYKTLFRLGLKLLGVYFCIAGVVGFLEYASVSLYINANRPMSSLDVILGALPPFVEVCFGLHLFFRGEWIVNLAVPSNRPYCPECAYDLRGNTSERCPECGTAIDMEKLVPPNSDE